jgi:hypothetical protein
LALAHGAAAQTMSPFQPALTDPRNAQRFNRPPETATTRERALVTSGPASVGGTGFDSTGSIGKKRKKPRPGERHVGKLPPPPPPPGAPAAPNVSSAPPPPGPPQQALGGRTAAPQIAARAAYADVYKPPDAPARQRRPAATAQDPFEPVGIRAGDFVLRPSIDITRGYDTNAERVPNGKSSGYTVVEPELRVKSEWARHEVGANLKGSYSWFDDVPFLDRPFADTKIYSRIDATRDTRIDLEGRFLIGTDNPGSPNLQADLAKLPIYQTFGGTIGGAQRFNHLELGAKFTADRTTYRDSELTDGSTFSNHDRDFNQYGVQGRASYEVTPGVKPFVEVAADQRKHDLEFDRSGFQRDSNALTPKVGGTFELSRLLTGEFSIGYLTRRYQDPRLAPLSGIVADGTLTWVATGLTTVMLTASSRAEESVVPGVSGALRRDVGVQVDHAFRRWLIGTLKFNYGFDEYVGLSRDDKRGTIGAALTYKLNRELWFKGEARHEWLRSNVTGVDYDANVFLLGLKLQR